MKHSGQYYSQNNSSAFFLCVHIWGGVMQISPHSDADMCVCVWGGLNEPF